MMGPVELESMNSQICDQKVSGPSDSTGIMILKKKLRINNIVQ